MGGSTFIGRVVSNRMQKSVVVAVTYVVWVPKYKVYEKRVSRHMAHDEHQECVAGDLVKIKVCRKMSKHKSYRVADILRHTHVLSRTPTADAKASSGSPVEAAEERLAAAQKRLVELRRMYQQEMEQLPGFAVERNDAQIAPAQPATL